jgi:hypothetical protein
MSGLIVLVWVVAVLLWVPQLNKRMFNLTDLWLGSVLAILWFFLSSCVGEPLRRVASAWWFYTQETAKVERRKYQNQFPEQQAYEMETRRRGF